MRWSVGRTRFDLQERANNSGRQAGRFLSGSTVNCTGQGCSKLGQDNPGLVRNLTSDMRAYKANSV